MGQGPQVAASSCRVVDPRVEPRDPGVGSTTDGRSAKGHISRLSRGSDVKMQGFFRGKQT